MWIVDVGGEYLDLVQFSCRNCKNVDNTTIYHILYKCTTDNQLIRYLISTIIIITNNI